VLLAATPATACFPNFALPLTCSTINAALRNQLKGNYFIGRFRLKKPSGLLSGVRCKAAELQKLDERLLWVGYGPSAPASAGQIKFSFGG
jgi:hypothetical protein